MAVSLPNGIILSVSKTIEAPAQLTGISNSADPTFVAAGIAAGDIIIVNSGWTALTGRVVRVSTANSKTVLSGIDTSDTNRFPAGGAAGTVRKITAWQQLEQVINIESSGGDQNYLTYGFLEDDYERRIPTTKTPVSIALTLADDPKSDGQKYLRSVSDTRGSIVARITYPQKGREMFMYGSLTVSSLPTFVKNEIMQITANFELAGAVTAYTE